MRFLKSKLIILFVIGTLILYLSNDFSLIDIKETALVVAVGIDFEDSEYEVSAQIAVPQATDQTATNKSAVISGKGKTLSYAIENIGAHTGWYIKLAFCNVIVLSKSAVRDDVMDSLDYFIRTDKIQDTVRVCLAEKKAKDILSANSPLDELSAMSITKIMEIDSESTSSVAYTCLREFSRGYYSKSRFYFMPLIKTISADNPKDSGSSGDDGTGEENQGGESGGSSGSGSEENSGGGNSDQSGGSSGSGSDGNSGGGQGGSGSGQSGGSSGSGSGSDKGEIFDATQTALFSNGKNVYTLDSEQTLVFNLLYHQNAEIYFLIKDIEYDGKKSDVMLTIKNNGNSQNLKIVNGRPILQININITAKIDDTDVTVAPKKLSDSDIVSKNILSDLEKLISETLTDIFENARQKECDVFEVRDKLFRTQNKYYAALKDLVLKETKLKVNVKATSRK